MKNSFLIICLVFIIVLDIVLLVLYKNAVAELQALHNSYNNSEREYKLLNIDQSNQFFAEDCMVRVNPEEKPKKVSLIINLKEDDCQQCLDSIFINLKKAKDIVGKENIIVWGNYNKERDLFVDLNSRGLSDLAYRRFFFSKFMLPLDQLNRSYFFVYNEENRASLVFIPDKDRPDRTLKYFQMVKAKYFTNELELLYN